MTPRSSPPGVGLELAGLVQEVLGPRQDGLTGRREADTLGLAAHEQLALQGALELGD